MTPSRRAGALLAIVLAAAAAPALAQTPPRPRNEPPPPPAAPWQVQFTGSAVIDTNIDHDRDDLDAAGGLFGGRLRYRTGGLTLDYRLGVNRFNAPTRWNRITNRAAARYEYPIDPAWTVDLAGEISFQQRSEDQELGNFYVASPAIVFDAGGGRAIRGFVTYRLKQIQDTVEDNVTNWYFGAELEQDVSSGRWLFEYRRELNLAEDPRRTYTGHRFTIEHRRDIGRNDEVRASLTYRPQRYRDRLVETADGDVLRRDRRWLPEIAWLHSLSADVLSRVEYAWEGRHSNETAREFSAHRFTVSFIWTGAF